MSFGITSQLINLLACPDCAGHLVEINRQLNCVECNRNFPIRNGIPILYPKTLNYQHLKEEESLARMMKRPRHTKKDQFSSLQWEYSKKEFWRMVKNNITQELNTMINIGCGFDDNFIHLEKDKHIIVNFDIVYDILFSLKKKYNSEYCVAGDINSLPFKKDSFDSVVCIDIIHHEADNVSHILKSFRKLIKPKGNLFLEDVNAWGLFQLPKSILLPKSVYRLLRNTYHWAKKSQSRPANYEFPTNVHHVLKILKYLEFFDIRVHPLSSYPSIGPFLYSIYRVFNRAEYVGKYHNYHYMISARKGCDISII